MAIIAPFIKSGLEKNEACFYIANDRSEEEVERSFSTHGINLKRAIKNGSFIFAKNNMTSDQFKPDELVGVLLGLVDKAKKDGFSGFRASGEMTWVLGSKCSCEELIDYESLLNEKFSTNLTGICQYNRKKFSANFIDGILKTHPVVILKNKICRNFYCESREIVRQGLTEDSVNYKVENLLKFQTMEENLRRSVKVRNDFFSIASHELKTPLTALKLRTQLQIKKKKTRLKDFKSIHQENLKNIDHLIGLVQGMVDATRFSKKLLSLRKVKT